MSRFRLLRRLDPRLLRHRLGRLWRHRGALKFIAGSVRRKGGFWNAFAALHGIYREKGAAAFKDILGSLVGLNTRNRWFAHYRAGIDPREIAWQGRVPISVVMPVYKVRPDWLEVAIGSVVAQTYPHWELICVDDHSRSETLSAILRQAASADRRVRHLVLDRNLGVSAATNEGIGLATGRYILLLDHDDVLEPQALARFADAAEREDPDLIYADEVITGVDLDHVLGVQVRPVFSHTFYLSHPFFVHPMAIRTALARQIGGLDASLTISHDVDFVLRALEAARTVTHIPDILYRWRTDATSAGHSRIGDVMDATAALKTDHLRRIGFPDAEVRVGRSFNTFRVRYFAAPQGRILAIVPTRNQARLLRRCVETVKATTVGTDLDMLVVDHESDDPETLAYLEDLRRSGAAGVVPFEGKFNYSAINNHAVAAAGGGYDFYLFLNNDIEAQAPGWLEPMVDLAMRADIGAVGATLLYPDGTVQHSGVIVGMQGAAEHAHKTLPFAVEKPGYLSGLHATRQYSAVTAACLLVPADCFRAVEGFDPRLEVGFNDTDLCLRIGDLGYRIVNCEEAVLLHHESASRGKGQHGDPHPRDSAFFLQRHAARLATDPHFSPLLNRDDPTFVLRDGAVLQDEIQYRSVTDILPKGRRRLHGSSLPPTAPSPVPLF